ncbi:MAG: sulfotransferase family 2 domain-containing protein [Pseudomonadota bacterium]|nr:sulfotransferase family 2 domain-containing protein [Pseudomonadota bacterium]
MLITPDFVFIHMPKTGGTFITQMLRLVYGTRAVETGRKHATCDEIPIAERGKPILSVIRSPFDRYVSQYHYGWWKTHPQEYCDPAPILQQFPSYPQVDFGDFVIIANRYFVNVHRGAASGYESPNLPPDLTLGWHSEQFIRFFCRDPHLAFSSIASHDLERGHLDRFEHPVEFLRTETLNRDLAGYLQRFSVEAELLRTVREHRPVMPGQAHEARARRHARDYYDPRLIDFVSRKEAFLFNRFPDYRMEAA